MDHFAVFTRSRFWKYSGVSDRIGGRVCHYLTRNWLGKWQTSDFSLKPFKRPHKRTLIPQMRTPQLLKKFSALPRAEQPNPLELKFFLLYTSGRLLVHRKTPLITEGNRHGGLEWREVEQYRLSICCLENCCYSSNPGRVESREWTTVPCESTARRHPRCPIAM